MDSVQCRASACMPPHHLRTAGCVFLLRNSPSPVRHPASLRRQLHAYGVTRRAPVSYLIAQPACSAVVWRGLRIPPGTSPSSHLRPVSPRRHAAAGCGPRRPESRRPVGSLGSGRAAAPPGAPRPPRGAAAGTLGRHGPAGPRLPLAGYVMGALWLQCHGGDLSVDGLV
jgi:hypothetical protein